MDSSASWPPSTPSSLASLVELSKKLQPPEPILLLTDSLETLRAFAERLRYAAAREGCSAAAELDVVVARREGLRDQVQLGPFEVVIDPRAPAGKVFNLRLPELSRSLSCLPKAIARRTPRY